MTPPEEVNSDKDDDIDSFFTVQNPTAMVSVLKQLNRYLQQPVGGLDSQVGSVVRAECESHGFDSRRRKSVGHRWNL